MVSMRQANITELARSQEMMSSRSLVFYFLCSCLTKCTRSESFVDITRRTDGDIFNNPASKCDVCEETARTSCEVHNNIETGGKCVSFENCCRECVCSKDRGTYLRHEERCIRNDNLTATLFRDLNQGCSFRLVQNNDNSPRGKQPCLFTNLRLHALNISVSGSQMIDVCGIFSWGISSCLILSGAFYHNGQWNDLWDAGSVEQNIFSVEKRLGVSLYLKWNGTFPSRFHGYVLSLDVMCYRKFNRSPVESCLLFKVKGTQMDIRPSIVPTTNFTGAPTKVASRGKQQSNDSTITIIISVVCALILVVLICVVALCIRKRGGLCPKKTYNRKNKENKLELRQTSGKLTITSPVIKDETKKPKQIARQEEAPVYTTPEKGTDKTAEYQNLLQAIASTPQYQPLVAKENKEAPRSSSPPYYHEPEKPGNKSVNSQDIPHFYHVLEGP